MKPLQNTRVEHIIRQTAATNGATLTSDNVDCKDYNYVTILVFSTTSNDATNIPTTLTVQQSDTTAATDFANIVAFTGGTATSTSAGFVLPAMPTATTTSPYAVFNINTVDLKRYLRLRVTPVTTQTFSVVALSGLGDAMPVNTTDTNAAVVVSG